MIYRLPGSEEALDQGDLVDGCFLLSVREFDLDGEDPPRIGVARNRVILLTQT